MRETSQGREFAIPVHEGSPPELGDALLEREIPSDTALITPLVVRTVENLREESLLVGDGDNRVGLCLEEALRNAVDHGNLGEFDKKVKLGVFGGPGRLTFVVSDQGSGFDSAAVESPILAEHLWDESGRGLFLVWNYMDEVSFYDGGRTAVMVRRR